MALTSSPDHPVIETLLQGLGQIESPPTTLPEAPHFLQTLPSCGHTQSAATPYGNLHMWKASFFLF